MSKNRLQTWLALVVLTVGFLLAAIAGLWIYMGATPRPLHPDVQKVQSVTHSGPSQEWAGAVKRGRQIMRVDITERNRPPVRKEETS